MLAAAMVASAVLTLLIPEPKVAVVKGKRDYVQWVKESVIDPFADFVSRRGWAVILLFVLFYKFGDALGGTMANPFYIEMGYTGVQIASVSKFWGVWMTIVGALSAELPWRAGACSGMLIGGFLQALTNFAFAYVAPKGAGADTLVFAPRALLSTPTHSLASYAPVVPPALTLAITADNIAGGAAGAALVAYLSSLCNVAFTATQYALLTSFMALGRTWLSSGSGWLADHTDWVTFWSLTAFLAVPGICAPVDHAALSVGRHHPAQRQYVTS